MLAQMLLSGIGVSGLDRARDQLVVAYDILGLAGRGQMQPAQPVDMSAAAPHQRPQILLSCGGVELGVEVIVGGHEGLEVASLRELLLQRDGVVQPNDQGRIRIGCIRSDTKQAVEIYKEITGDKTSVEELLDLLKEPGMMEWNLEPQGTMKFAAHLFKTGTLKTQPKAWTDYYLPVAHDLKGN